MAERSADWMAQAERDLDHARLSLEAEHFEWACFAAQQAAEKAVKALYEALGGEVRGHSVSGMLSQLPEKHRTPGALVEKAAHLDLYYVPTRYPNAFHSGAPRAYFTRAQAEEALANARAIVEHCQSQIRQSRGSD